MGPFLRSVHEGKTLKHVSQDILGDAYEWILKYFVPSKARREKFIQTAR
jgi:type I restriction-modification system DNA methylase subunit